MKSPFRKASTNTHMHLRAFRYIGIETFSVVSLFHKHVNFFQGTKFGDKGLVKLEAGHCFDIFVLEHLEPEQSSLKNPLVATIRIFRS